MVADESQALAQVVVVESQEPVKYQRQAFLSKDGYEVSIYSGYWRLNKDTAFNFEIPVWIGDDLDDSFRQILAFMVRLVRLNMSLVSMVASGTTWGIRLAEFSLAQSR